MSSFEIVSFISKIPGVIDLVSRSINLIRTYPGNPIFSGDHKGAELQLLALQYLLISLQRRYQNDTKDLWSADCEKTIDQCMRDLGQELESLIQALESVKIAYKKGERRLFRGVSRAVSEYEAKVEAHLEWIEAFKSLITFTLANRINGHTQSTIEEAPKEKAKTALRAREILQPCNADFIPLKSPGTLDWVLSHPLIEEWMDPSQHKLAARALCIYGVKGCGKSVLASSLFADMTDQKLPVAFFSFWAQSESQRKAAHMLATLAWQLVSTLLDDEFNSIAPVVLALQSPGPKELIDLLDKAIPLLKEPGFLIVDGLDESRRTGRGTQMG